MTTASTSLHRYLTTMYNHMTTDELKKAQLVLNRLDKRVVNRPTEDQIAEMCVVATNLRHVNYLLSQRLKSRSDKIATT